MSLALALALGLLQGLTEFLPVSSSGHLALAQLALPGFEQPGVLFDALLHLGTAGAVVVFERQQLRRWLTTSDGHRLLLLLGLGTIATALVALPLRRLVHGAFSSPLVVGCCLVLTGVVVSATRWLGGGERGEGETRWFHAVAIGLVQGMAVFPGISRSGSTIAAGLVSGCQRRWAARFCFLLSVPAIAGATLVELVGERHQLAALGFDFWLPCLAATAVAGISGYLALALVIRTLASRVFHRFGWYCLPLGLLVVALTVFGGDG
jgi:undecaprenyl-diphosphatase